MATQNKKWKFGYVWKDETGDLHIEDRPVEAHCGCVTLHIPAGHLEGLMAGPWISRDGSHERDN